MIANLSSKKPRNEAAPNEPCVTSRSSTWEGSRKVVTMVEGGGIEYTKANRDASRRGGIRAT
jgi:hypothetical protein